MRRVTAHFLKGRAALDDVPDMAVSTPTPELVRSRSFLRVSLPLRLVLLSLIFAVPIVSVAVAAYVNVTADVRAIDTEEQGVIFNATAVRLGEEAAALPPGRPVSAERRMDFEISLKELDDSARVFKKTSLEADVLSPVRLAWPSVARGPTGKNLDRFENALLHAVDLISEASKLTYESHVIEGNLQDAQFTGVPLVVQHLGVAGTIAELAPHARAIPINDRVKIAGLLAQADAGREDLSTDMLGAFRADSELRTGLEPLWNEFTSAADALENPVSGAIYGEPTAASFAALRSRLVGASAKFTDALHDELLTRFEARLEEAQLQHRLIVLLDLFGLLASSGLLLLVGRSIARRDRRELLHAQTEARTLAAELTAQQAERARMLTEAQFRAILARSNMGIALLDENGATIECNEAVVELLGEGASVISPSDPQFQALIDGVETSYVVERNVQRPEGSRRWTEVSVSVVSIGHPSSVAALATVRDITERKAIDERLVYAATHDQVTSLPNRPEFLRHLERVVAERIATGRNFAVLFIDLDGFKVINDRLGHHAGDRLLIVTARRLLSLSREGDVVARFHGDEFAILLRDIRDLDAARAIADRVQAELRAPVTIDGSTATVTSSIGIVMGNEAYVRAEDVIRNADAAMYHAKSLGRSTAVVFDDAMQHRLASRMRMMSDLQAGIERGEFRIAYQPVVDLVSGYAVGFEALLRWDHPIYGDVPPATFIPLAEESGAIIELGRFVLRKSCIMLAGRTRARQLRHAPAMNVNLSVTQLMEPNIVKEVERALVESGLRPDLLMLEITESALLEDGPRAIEVLSRLKALGVRLCIDDFGTGYSSLRYLHQFPIDALKIDRSFVNGRDGGIANEPIVQMVITLALSLGMDVVAEGIESRLQREKLIAAGCVTGQGFYFAHPLDRLEDVDKWLGGSLAESG
jgi:diguanylate cyclase (GGDEF)-like protein/PAS domain S-box-containing protein